MQLQPGEACWCVLDSSLCWHGCCLETTHDPLNRDDVTRTLSEFETRVGELERIFHERVDLLQCEPLAFAADMKAENRQRWQARPAGISAAVGDLLK